MANASGITVKVDSAAKAALKSIKEEIRKGKDNLHKETLRDPMGMFEKSRISARISGLEKARDILTAKLKTKKGGKK